MGAEYAYVLTGQTFQHRQQIKNLGFVWDAGEKVWVMRRTDNDLKAHTVMLRDLKKLAGVSVSEQFAEKFIVLSRYCRF